jgi:Fe-Mn family superoxide dismutase
MKKAGIGGVTGAFRSTTRRKPTRDDRPPYLLLAVPEAGGRRQAAAVLRALDESFGSYEQFAEQFKAANVGRFGSGWGWLVLEGNALKIISTPNADNPLAQGQKAVLTCDVWEHAYYLDYQNRRPDFVQAFLDHLVNWGFVAENLGK